MQHTLARGALLAVGLAFSTAAGLAQNAPGGTTPVDAPKLQTGQPAESSDADKKPASNPTPVDAAKKPAAKKPAQPAVAADAAKKSGPPAAPADAAKKPAARAAAASDAGKKPAPAAAPADAAKKPAAQPATASDAGKKPAPGGAPADAAKKQAAQPVAPGQGAKKQAAGEQQPAGVSGPVPVEIDPKATAQASTQASGGSTDVQLPPHGFTYRQDGRRDPFVTLVKKGAEATAVTAAARAAGLAGLASSEITVRGILTSEGRYLAMVLGADDKTYIVHTGDKLADGTIQAITADAMIIQQRVSEQGSSHKTREIRKRLRRTDATN